MVRIVASLAAIVAVTGLACERPKAPINGIGGFQLAKTTLASVENQATGRCFVSNDRANCMIIARQTIAKRAPQIQLEFAGRDSDSVLRRILLSIPGCNLDEVRSWFIDRVGKPGHTSERGALWQQKYIVLSLIESGPARCQVVAVDPVDEVNVAAVRQTHGVDPEPPRD